MPPRKTRAAKKAEKEAVEEAANVVEEILEKAVPEEEDVPQEEPATSEAQPPSNEEAKMTMEERMAKMKELRKKMADSSTANRRAVATELNKQRQNGKQSSTLSRKLQKAEKVLDKRDAEEKGEDWERARAWGYSIEDNDRWEDKLEQKEEGKDQGAIDPNSAAERSYRRQIKQLKPDMKAYASQKGIDAPSSSSTSFNSSALIASSSNGQIIRREDLPTGQSALTYGEHKPDDAALDRVAGHLNAEAVLRTKHSRRRPDDSDAEVNYINDKNKHFNKKIARFYDKYTTEIRENFERGTAL